MAATFPHASQRLTNIIKSVKDYTITNLVTTESLNLRWNGSPEEVGSDDEFIDVYADVGERRFFRVASSTDKYGYNLELGVRFEIYVENQYIYNTNNFRHLEIRDILHRYFEVGQLIMIKDFENSKADIYNAIVHEIPQDSELEQSDQYHGYLFTVNLWFQEIRV